MSNIKIKQLSKSDQIIGVVSCPSGKISVFRAKNNDDLLPYQRAISNSPGPEKFSIEKDELKLNLDEIICIGLVKKQVQDITLQEFLNYSQNETTLDSMTKQFELNNKLNAKLEDLTECELRRAEILRLSFSSEKLVAINLPFEPISFNLKETVAEFLLDICSNQNHTIIITSMNYRPQSWIDNELINRVEVGQNRQKTIGLGDTPSELQAMLEEVRKEAKNETPESSFLDVPLNEKKINSNFSLLFLSLPIIFIIGATFYFLSNDKDPIVAKNTNDSLIENSEKEIIKNKIEKKEQFALNKLPSDIRKSIVDTFQGTSESINYKKQKTKSKKKAYKQNTQNDSAGDSLLQALQKTSNTAEKTYGKSINPPQQQYRRSSTPSDSGPSNSAMSNERREVLRQKFKEALMRATKR